MNATQLKAKPTQPDLAKRVTRIYSIYPAHYAALSLIVKVLSAFDLERLLVPVLGTIVALSGLAAGLVCHEVLERPLIEATRRVLGQTIQSWPKARHRKPEVESPAPNFRGH